MQATSNLSVEELWASNQNALWVKLHSLNMSTDVNPMSGNPKWPGKEDTLLRFRVPTHLGASGAGSELRRSHPSHAQSWVRGHKPSPGRLSELETRVRLCCVTWASFLSSLLSPDSPPHKSGLTTGTTKRGSVRVQQNSHLGN